MELSCLIFPFGCYFTSPSDCDNIFNCLKDNFDSHMVGWPSGLRRYVQVVVNNVGAGSNPASTSVFFVIKLKINLYFEIRGTNRFQ